MIPWRHTFTTDLTPDQILDRLEDVTDEEESSIWGFLLSPKACLCDSLVSTKLRGTISRQNRTFYMHALLSTSGRFQTVFNGSIKETAEGSRVRVWISSSAGSVFTQISLVAFFVILCWKTLVSSRTSQGLLVSILCAALILLAINSLTVHASAIQAFRAVLENPRGLGQCDPWPLTPITAGEASAKRTRLPSGSSTVEHFKSFADRVLADPSTPPHTLQEAHDGELLTLSFPPQSSEGYEVRAVVDNRKGITVWAGALAHIPPVALESPRDAVASAFGLMRDLLSPVNRLHERYSNGELYYAGIETTGTKGWDEVFSNRLKGRKPSGIMSEKYFINHQMPVRPE